MSNIESSQRPECDGLSIGCTKDTESFAFIKRSDNKCTKECGLVRDYGNVQVTTHTLTLTFSHQTDNGQLNNEEILETIRHLLFVYEHEPDALVIEEISRATARLLATDKEVTV